MSATPAHVALRKEYGTMESLIHILHLEDNPADAELVAAKLAEADFDFRIIPARTRDEFETALLDDGIDIILADYRLAMYDGMSVLRLARKQCPDIPLIFVSGAIGEETAIEALTQGAVDYVLKHNLSRLAPAVKRALREARNRRERKQAQEELQRSNEMLRAIIEAAPVAIVGLDLEGRVQSVWNPAAEKILGWRAKEVFGRPLPTVPEDHQEEFRRFMEQLRSGKTLDGVEVRRRRRDGAPIDYSIHASLLHGAEGRVSGSISVLVDITERKQAERERLANLRFFESMDRINRAFQGADDLEEMMRELLDIVLSIFDCDRAFLMYPCDPESPTWSCPMERNKPEYPGARDLKKEMQMDPRVADTLRILLAADGPATFGPGAGHPLPADFSEHFRLKSFMSMALFPRVGKPWQFGIHQCSHARVWAAEEKRLLREIGRRLEDGLTSMLAYRNLRESEAGYRQIVDTANEGIWVGGPDAVTTFVNARMAEMLGCSVEEMIGRPVTDFMFEEDMPDQARKRENRRQGMPEYYERRFRHRDGQTVWTHVSATPIFDAGRHFNGSFAMFTDITEHKRAEIRLNEQIHFLQQLLDSIPIPVNYKDKDGLYLGCNAAFEAFMGLPRKSIVGKTVYEIAPKERADKHHETDSALVCRPGMRTYELSGLYGDGKHHDVIFYKATFVDANDCVAGTVCAMMDITERKRAERERLANLRFFESMDRVNRAIQGADDLEKMMRQLLKVVLSIFDCDRAFLMYPCDPESPAWSCPMEINKPDYPGVRDLKKEMPMDEQVAETLRILLAADGPVTFGPGAPHALPENISKQFGVKCFMSMALYPKTGGPWQFGIHQCAYARAWTAEEMRMFEAIGRRLADGLSSLLSYRDLRENKDFLDNVVEHIPNMIFVKDAQTLRFVRFNRAGERLVGYSRQELLGKTDHDFFPGEEADFFAAKDRQVLDGKELVDIPEETIHNRSNEERILHTQKIPILDETGTPRFLLGISEDITERKKAEESIRKLSQAVEQSPVSIVITDVKGAIEFVNTTFTQITGYTYAEALGRNPRILKSGETPAAEYNRLWNTISLGGVWRGEFRNRKKNGELFWEHATIAPIRDADNVITHYVAVKEDVTERKNLEEQFRQSQKMEAIGQLAGGVAHDFNNMLGVIIGYADLVLNKAALDDSLRKDIEEIKAAGLRSSEITRQLLAFARKQTIAPRILDLNKTVEGMLKLLRRLIGEDIDLAWAPGEALWPVKMDPSQIDQILANLCVNARDAIAGVGKVTIETKKVDFDDAYCFEHRGFSPGEFVMLAVSDNGCGMDKPAMDKIFEPFFTTKGSGKGTGLGLATVYGIVKQNEGFINVYSEPGLGSTFMIYLPRHTVTTGREPKASPAPRAPRGHETILVVEDESMILEMVKLMLETLGYRVLAASTPGEAIRIAGERSVAIDLLLTDVVMPGMTGRDLVQNLNSLYPELKCLFMSGYTGDVIAHHGVLDEGVHFIQKPFSRRELAAKAREVLDSK